jgi:fatty acid desaturase
MEHRPLGAYARELKAVLPAKVFARAPSRLLWLPFNYGVIAALAWVIATGRLPWPLLPVASVIIAIAFAGTSFTAHELLHGALVTGRKKQLFFGWFGFLPFVVSPRLWVAWHNKTHHQHTNQIGLDPDAYPTRDEYEQSRVIRVVTDHFALGRRRLRGFLSLLFGFTGQSGQMLVNAAKRKMLTPAQQRLAYAETGLAIATWLALAFVIGLWAFVWVYALPLVIANALIMAYILTNHGLSPLTEVNDPLAHTLSVTVPRWYELVTLGFGFHVEHHMFPAMSTRNAPAVRDALRERYPTRYQSMPLVKAVVELHRTSRIYGDSTTLVDPTTEQRWPTLGPIVVDPARAM